MRGILALSVAMSLAGCSDWEDERYASWAEANRAGAVEKGWLPPFVPTNARDISDTHNLDTNEQKLTFTVPANDVLTMLESIDPHNELREELAAKAFREVGWTASEVQDAQAILLCTQTYSGIVVANRRTGQAVYVSPAEWARKRCPKPL